MEIDLTRQSLSLPIKGHHDVGDARRQAMLAARELDLDETAASNIGIIATELAGNLVKHASGGDLILRATRDAHQASLEIMTLDDGPGMNVSRCMEDGYSTAGSPGTGLGAIARLASTFDAYSLAGRGTVLVATTTKLTGPRPLYEIGAVCLPVGGERYCGDAWAVHEYDRGITLMVSDGLGHGIGAAEASDLAIKSFRQNADRTPSAILAAQHTALQSSRGAAALVGTLDDHANLLSCAGVGNIAGFVMSTPKPRGVVSMNGIVGHNLPKVRSFDYEATPAETLIFHSDGLTSRWKLEDFPALLTQSPAIIAGIIYKTYKRGKDDATVLVVRRR